MRVIAGSARGTRLEAPKGFQTRPTADRVKEALFSIIASRWQIAHSNVLDICAGTGALGIEALSRGAAGCLFIEQNRNTMSILEKNVILTKVVSRTDLLPMDARHGVAVAVAKKTEFDIIFFDPPYEGGLYKSVISEIDRSDALASGGVLVVESSLRSISDTPTININCIDRRIYGDTALDFYVRAGSL